jgi:ferredoxin-thioredoxin reductase catalytic subunit
MTESESEMRERLQAYADSQGFVLNSDIDRLSLVMKGLHNNAVKHGAPYCPCRIRTSDPEENNRIICPCAFHKDEIKQHGFCHCHLFYAA